MQEKRNFNYMVDAQFLAEFEEYLNEFVSNLDAELEEEFTESEVNVSWDEIVNELNKELAVPSDDYDHYKHGPRIIRE